MKPKLAWNLVGVLGFILLVIVLAGAGWWLWVNGPEPVLAAEPPLEPAISDQQLEKPKVGVQSDGCPEPEDVDKLLGVPIGTVVKVSTEKCAFGHRSFPMEATFTCPMGDYVGEWVCTFDVKGDKVTHEGIGQSASVWGSTFRYMPQYHGETVCDVWKNEDANGQDQSPSFHVRFQAVTNGVQSCN